MYWLLPIYFWNIQIGIAELKFSMVSPKDDTTYLCVMIEVSKNIDIFKVTTNKKVST